MASWFQKRFRRVRYIPQLEATECGAAGLAMVLDYHGAARPLVAVRRPAASAATA